MSQNDIVERVLSRLEERNILNEDQLIEGIINLLEESGVDLENISEEKLDEIFKSIGKAVGSFMTGGEFKDPARRDADYKGAIKKAGFQRKMRDRQAARAAAAQAVKKPMAKKKPMGKPKPAAAPMMAARKPLSKKARNAEFAATRDKARSMRRRDLALESRLFDMLADILIENRLNGNSTTERVDEIFGAIKSAIKSGVQGFKNHRYNQKLGIAAEKRVAAMPTKTNKQQRAKGLAADKLGDAQKADYKARYGRDD